MRTNPLQKLIAKNSLELEITKLQQSESHKQSTCTLIQKGTLLDKYFDTQHYQLKKQKYSQT